MNKNVFHLGLCMAGSVSAGAYTAGVVDYLIEALENWEKAKVKDDPSVPQHQVIIDLLCGASGGGITSAMIFFALQDRIDHVQLKDNGAYTIPANNILWKSWVELSGGDIFQQLLSDNDISRGYVSSALNAGFIDKVAEGFRAYIEALPQKKLTSPPFFGPFTELFVTLFNITGINYELFSKAPTSANAGKQYTSDHRDIAHFRWSDQYQDDGRMPVSLTELKHVQVIIDAAKATGAFPVGLKARTVTREARFIWDNPFFNRDKNFDDKTIFLGNGITERQHLYTSINGDGGVANNEPVELARRILLNMRAKKYGDIELKKEISEMDKKEKEEAKKKLVNTSVILIDPFPSADNAIETPVASSDNLLSYTPHLVGAMRSQLLFDAKEALDAYKKNNYGLHIIAPSRKDAPPPYAIACGSLGGFGGFLEREFRVHDFFLGRHNCQSFLRKYFVVNPAEPPGEDRECVDSIIDSYNETPIAKNRFCFKDENNNEWVPIIPDVTLDKPIKIIRIDGGKPVYDEANVLPTYPLPVLKNDFLEKYRSDMGGRYTGFATNLFKLPGWMSIAIGITTLLTRKKVSNAIIKYISDDFKKRGLMKP